MMNKKKLLFSVFTVIFMMALAGCAANQEMSETTDETNVEPSADAENDIADSTEESATGDEADSTEESATSDEADSTEESVVLNETEASDTDAEEQESNILILTINGTELTAVLEENSSVSALLELLSDGPLTIEMSDYGSMEKVGAIGTELPRNDEQITTEAGDLILYQGNAFVIYYAPNSWNLTRLGKIQGITGDKLKELLGDGDVSVTLSLPD